MPVRIMGLNKRFLGSKEKYVRGYALITEPFYTLSRNENTKNTP
jgi:hypothetical protein